MAKSCSKIEIPNNASEPLISWVDETPETKYVWDALSSDTPLSDRLVFLALVFFWPLPFLFLTSLGRKLFLYLRMAGELVFGILAAYLYILPTVFLGEMMIGGYVYLSATGIYLITTLVELYQITLAHLKGRDAFSSPPSEPSENID